jgi:hypothetical protein
MDKVLPGIPEGIGRTRMLYCGQRSIRYTYPEGQFFTGQSNCELNVTGLATEFIEGECSNIGFLIKARDESDNTCFLQY